MLELLLINHPLDCPICDQAGECELQDYVFQEGRAGTRYKEYAKRYNPVEDFGPDVLYVPNRCILCTRCVRFMEDVADTPVLNVSERGDRAYIGIAEQQRLDHPWAGNVVDLCPVGSLLSKDFLHKARAWDLDKTASVCPGCTQGCNINIDTRDDVVVRIRPRPNLEVNRHFICDYGRMNYRWMNRGDRVEAPLVRDGGRHVATDWDTALARLDQVIRGAVGQRGDPRLRPRVHRIARTGAADARPLRRSPPRSRCRWATRRRCAGIPGLALRRERAPNLAGAELLGYTAEWAAALRRCASAGLVIVLDADLGPDDEAALAGAPGLVVVLATVMPEAAERRADPAGHQHGRGERDLRQPRPPDPALPAGQGAAGHGAAGLVGRGRGARRAGARCRRRPRPPPRRSRCWASAGRCSPA